MKSSMVCVFALAAVQLGGAPLLYYRGIVNAASNVPPGLPNAAIARGSLFSISGKDLGPASEVRQLKFPLEAALAGVTVEVRQGETRLAAIPVAVKATRVVAIMPSQVPLGKVSVQVTYNGVSSNYTGTLVAEASFGIFSANGIGAGPGYVQNVNSKDERTRNSLKNPAKREQAVVVWGTGLGAVADDLAAPGKAELATPVEVFAGGKTAATIFKGRHPSRPGVDVVIFRVPKEAPLGCYVPVQVRVNGAVSSNAVTIAIAEEGAGCADEHSPASKVLAEGGSLGLILMGRYKTTEDVDSATAKSFVDDRLAASFDQGGENAYAFHPAVSLPPLGSCTVYARTGGVGTAVALSFVGLLPGRSGLDAGPAVSVEDVAIARSTKSTGLYAGSLGGTRAGAPLKVLASGKSVSVAASGGGEIGAFRFEIAAPADFDFDDRARVRGASRAQALELTWGAREGTVVVAGFNFDKPNNATGMFVCSAAGSGGGFRVPTEALEVIPQSRKAIGASTGYLMLGLIAPGGQVEFQAPGVEHGYATSISWAVKSVYFQ
ncbi:MAG: hypothetical protein HY821_24130 [Acidobacteria bacterium]|nr:hypothetical protein [Acidobacteriota bacterium]